MTINELPQGIEKEATKPFTAEEWAQTPKKVQNFVLALMARVEALEAEVADLREQLQRNSHNSSQPPSQDGEAEKANKRKTDKGKGKRGARYGHSQYRRRLVPVEQVREVIVVKPSRCQQCGQNLSGEDRKPRRHQVTELPPFKAETTEYQLHSLSCPACQRRSRAPLPEGVPKGAFGPRLQAMVALLAGRYHLSKRDSRELMRDFFKVNICLGTVSRLEKRCSSAIAGPVEDAKVYVQQQAACHLDETGWRELNQRAWLWVAASKRVTVFLIQSSRGGKVAKQLLTEDFRGIVHSDRWSAYNWLPVAQRQLCWAHLKRDFQAFAERPGPSAAIGEQLLSQLKLIFDAWHGVEAGTRSRAWLQNELLACQTQVGELLRQGSVCSHPKTAGSCRDILKRENALWTFIYHDGVVPTNNFAEQQIRPAVLWRNTSFGTQSEAGSRFVERLMTVVATLKLQDRNVLDYLVQACQAANSNAPPPSLIPLNSS